MTRLNSSIRQAIVDACIKQQFEERELALKKEEHDIGMELYREVFYNELTSNGTKLLNAITKIPVNWFNMSSDLWFNCGVITRAEIKPYTPAAHGFDILDKDFDTWLKFERQSA